MKHRIRDLLGVALGGLLLGLAPPGGRSDAGFITTTFGNGIGCEHTPTLKSEGDLFRFDLSGLPEGIEVLRAVLRVSELGRKDGATIRAVPVGLPEAKPFEPCPPDFGRFDLLSTVRAWTADPAANKGFRVEASGGIDFRTAVLEVSYAGSFRKSLPRVTGLCAVQRSGQTFLTWKEPEDVVGEDAPIYESFEKAILEARARRRIVYRVYRHEAPITPQSLGRSELLAEIPEAISCWNLRQLKVKDSEHIRKGERPSLLHGQHLYPGQTLEHRYRVGPGDGPLARATGLAVLTAKKRAAAHYAVTVAVDGREAVAELRTGENTAGPVEEEPARYPAIVWQRTSRPGEHPQVDVYCAWLEPPYVPQRRAVDFYLPQWKDLPKGSDRERLPVFLFQGGREGDMDLPSLYAARRYVEGAFTLGVAPGHTLFWPGQHESIGTLRGFDQGVVWNYEQRRAMALLAWALENREFFLDPERVYTWGLLAAWGLRHGDLFAVVMSDGHNTFKTSRYPKEFFWRWYPAAGTTNWLGVDHLDYLDLARWVRENPTVELPFWIGFPAYGFFPDHTLGDYGFRPWQEFLAAMKETRRAFSATWLSNGPGNTSGVIRDMVPRIRLHQSLPAFTRCSLDSSPFTDHPKGTHPYQGDPDFTKYADKEGGINLYERWDPDTLIDEARQWELTVWLDAKAPGGSATLDVTPRRCQKFKSKPGEEYRWSIVSLDDQRILQAGKATADAYGLVTLPQIEITTAKRRIQITP